MKTKIKNLKNKQGGITLVALVITIIILLILATISIQSLTNTGLFQKANEAKDKTKNATENQAKTLNEYEDELNKYISETKEYKLADKVKVGDYVKYEPDTASTDSILQELETYSGSDANTTSTLTQESLNWRVLDVKDGQVRLISEVPTTSTITLSGYNGYNNAVKLIDDTCSTLYNNSKFASKVQNLKIEDIQDKMVESNYNNIDTNYGKTFTPTYKYYPSIIEKEKAKKVNGTEGIELDVSEQKELINQEEKSEASSLEVKYTQWRKTMTTNDFKDSKYYELFINNGNNYAKYWISSRCVCASSLVASFGVNIVLSGDIFATGLIRL